MNPLDLIRSRIGAGPVSTTDPDSLAADSPPETRGRDLGPPARVEARWGVERSLAYVSARAAGRS